MVHGTKSIMKITLDWIQFIYMIMHVGYRGVISGCSFGS